MDAVYSFDLSVFEFIENYIWNPVLDVIMSVITTLGDGGIIWIALAICLLISKKYRKVGAMMACGLIFSLIFTDSVIKPLVNRPRPFNYEPLIYGITAPCREYHHPEFIHTVF